MHALRLALITLLLTVSGFAQSVSQGVSIGYGTIIGLTSGGGSQAAANLLSLPAGTYTGTQSVSINCPTGLTCFYTTDGSPANIASTEYTGTPISVAASATINVVAAQTCDVAQNTQATSTDWKCTNVNGGQSGGLTCQAGGGVGSIQPSAWSMSYGTPATWSVSTTASSSETQQLFIYTDHTTACQNADMLVEDKTIQAGQNQTFIANNELDAFLFDTAHHIEYMAGLQCDQQSGTMQWQLDSGDGTGWHNTGIACNISATSPTHVSLITTRDIGGTGCTGGRGCLHYKTLCVNGTCTALNTDLGLEALPSTWSDAVGNQDQIDLTNTATSGQNPTTGTRQVWDNNITAGYSSSLITSSATYTISGTASYPVTPPQGATELASLEQQTGWSGDSTASVSGAYAPAVCEINPTGQGNPCPGAGTTAGGTYSGGGGGSTLTLTTTGESGKYTGWMAKKSITTTCGQYNMLLSGTYTFTGSVAGIQAWEFGRRATNCSGITDNGQTQLVPKSGQLEFDIVPSSSGGWTDTGCRFPMFVANTAYTEQLYYVNDANGALSLEYVSLNGTVCTIPSNLQHVAGSSLGWSDNGAVIAFQPDDNMTGDTYSAQVTVTAYTW